MNLTIHFSKRDIEGLRERIEFAFLEDREIVETLVSKSIQQYLDNTNP